MVHIFPTNRAVRAFYEETPEADRLLEKAYSLQSFFEEAIYVKGFKRADTLIRDLCMQEAIKFDSFKELKIPTEFMAFVKYSDYLFRFFSEISSEKKSFHELLMADTYANYEEHLKILEKVYDRYCKKLEDIGYFDSITVVKNYTIDEEFLASLKEITIYHDGYFSPFEHEVFTKISKKIPLFVKAASTPYNQKEIEKIYNTKIQSGFLTQGRWLEQPTLTKELPTSLNVTTSSFSQRSLQVGFVFDQITRFLEQNIAPQRIAVVLPDDSFADFLRLYDKNRILNFAMGFSYKESEFYKKLNANWKLLNTKNTENHLRVERLGELKGWSEAWQRSVNFNEFAELLEIKDSDETIQKVLLKSKRVFEWFGTLVFKDAITLFLQELGKQRVDDVGGGPVTVMGVLETRGSSYEGVIIPDFNESLIPKRSKKDLFLSSQIRSFASMPTSFDREQLQRYFYHKLLAQARIRAISYVENEEEMPSRFLDSFNKEYWSYDPEKLLFFMPFGKELDPIKEVPKTKHQITNKPLSASRLRTLLTCHRQYYYKYIEQIPQPNYPADGLEAAKVGSAIHKAFEKIYKNPINEKIFTDKEFWLQSIKEALYSSLEPSLWWEFEAGIWAKRVEFIAQKEMERFEKGWRPYKLEEALFCDFEGISLKGIIDRIDKNPEGMLEVLDYKSGQTLQQGPKSVENRVDFQLIFYYILASSLGEVANVGYFDLKEGGIVYEKTLQDSLDRVSQILKESVFLEDFEMTTKKTNCTYCPYVLLCQRGRRWS